MSGEELVDLVYAVGPLFPYTVPEFFIQQAQPPSQLEGIEDDGERRQPPEAVYPHTHLTVASLREQPTVLHDREQSEEEVDDRVILLLPFCPPWPPTSPD